MLLVYNLLHTSFLSIDDLVTANCMDESMEDTIMENFSALVFDRHEQDLPHNPYDQEFREFSSIEQGNIEMLKKSLQEDYTGKIGTLAKDEVRNMRNRGIVVITLASRAAIRGGLLPEVAFSMSDVFIQKLEEETDTAILLNMMHQFEFKFAEMVADLNSQKAGRPKKDQNPLIDRCKDYIFKHLHEKIRIQNIADELFLNANYLSEIFRRHEGLTITEFILREKVNLTKNLLAYSPYSYSEIAAYDRDVLIIHGDADDIVPLSYSKRALEAYPSAELKIMSGAGYGFSGDDARQATGFELEYLNRERNSR